MYSTITCIRLYISYLLILFILLCSLQFSRSHYDRHIRPFIMRLQLYIPISIPYTFIIICARMNIMVEINRLFTFHKFYLSMVYIMNGNDSDHFYSQKCNITYRSMKYITNY